MIIESGIGKPTKVGVTDDYRLMAESLTLAMASNSSKKGRAFILSSNIISITTTASFSGILYFKNTNLGNQVFIERISMHSTQVTQWRAYKNTTTGTLVSSGTSFEPCNLNFSSGAKFIGTALRGSNDLTITDGTLIAPAIQNVGPASFELRGSFIVDENNSFAIECKPAASAEVAINIHCYVMER